MTTTEPTPPDTEHGMSAGCTGSAGDGCAAMAQLRAEADHAAGDRPPVAAPEVVDHLELGERAALLAAHAHEVAAGVLTALGYQRRRVAELADDAQQAHQAAQRAQEAAQRAADAHVAALEALVFTTRALELAGVERPTVGGAAEAPDPLA